MIPHLAGLVAMLLVSRSSDRRLERRYHTAVPLAVAGAALAGMGLVSSSYFSLVLWSFAAMGLYSFFGPFFAMPSTFLTGFAAASGIALLNSVGNLGGFLGPSVIGAMAARTGGIYGGIAFAGVALFVSSGLILLLPAKPGRK
jgi:ACS family tartrate transporter-like MFS transporter